MDVASPSDERPYSVLFVCMGNICRSPLAEQLLRSRIEDAGLAASITVASAGLGAVVGAPMDQIPAEISLRLGGDPSGARGRQLRGSIVADADLILTMTREQRDKTIKTYPRALQRTFTMIEFTSLLALAAGSSDAPVGADGDRIAPAHFSDVLRERSRAFARSRSRVRLRDSDDVTDPYRRSRAVHEAVGEQIALACSHIVHSFASWSIDEERLEDRLS